MANPGRVISCVALLLVSPALVTGGQAIGQAPTDVARARTPAPDARLERLAGLARLWVAARYFHPALAYEDIDWDAALVAAIPRVDRARTGGEYRDAIDSLLAVLGDPATFSALGDGADAPAAPAAAPRPSRDARPVRDLEGATLIDILSLATTMGSDNSKSQPLMAEARAALAKDGPFLIDCRGTEAPDAESGAEMMYYTDTVLRDLLRGLLTDAIPLGAPRYRQYSGYPPQQGTTSGGYTSAVVTNTPQRLEGTRAPGPPPRAVVLVNDNTPDIREILSGLRAAGVVWVVREDRTGDVRRPMTSAPMELADGVHVHLRTVDVVSPDGVVGIDPDVVVRRGPNDTDVALARALEVLRGPAVTRTAKPATSAGSARPLMELAYPTMTAPTREYRLLALFRFWGVINRFFPYKHLLETPWSEVLPRFIPVFESAEGTLAYQTAIHQLVAQIKDTHGTVSGTSALSTSLGGFAPPVALGYAGRVLVVLAVGETVPGDGVLARGDEVLAIDGESIEARVARLGRLFAASTPQALRWRTRLLLTAGAQGSKARFTIRDGAGRTRDVEFARQMAINQLAGFVPRAHVSNHAHLRPAAERLWLHRSGPTAECGGECRTRCRSGGAGPHLRHARLSERHRVDRGSPADDPHPRRRRPVPAPADRRAVVGAGRGPGHELRVRTGAAAVVGSRLWRQGGRDHQRRGDQPGGAHLPVHRGSVARRYLHRITHQWCQWRCHQRLVAGGRRRTLLRPRRPTRRRPAAAADRHHAARPGRAHACGRARGPRRVAGGRATTPRRQISRPHARARWPFDSATRYLGSALAAACWKARRMSLPSLLGRPERWIMRM